MAASRYAQLGLSFARPVPADPLPDPRWVATSPEAAQALGLPPAWSESGENLALLSGHVPAGLGRPQATVYSGHQFGTWAGQLGDGRALLLGELTGPEGTHEVQLKGSGRTPYSRMGDGRAVLRSSVREFLASEALHALGVPTTRALCVIASDLPVRRETPETAAIVTRTAPSFLRFGHFEHFCHHGLLPELRTLADFVVDTHYPECRDARRPHAALLAAIAGRTAELMARWQSLGFCHGVMNTDNMSVLGLTIDYGPFGFMDGFDPGHVCNHSDHQGRYAWASQPNIGWWNLHALAQAFVPLLDDVEAAREAISGYPQAYSSALDARYAEKLGLGRPQAGDQDLVNDWLRLLAQERIDFTLAHRALADVLVDGPVDVPASVQDLVLDREGLRAWVARYRARLREGGLPDATRGASMRRANPRVVLRNHLAETAIQRAQAGDFSEVQRLQRVLSTPYDDHPETVPSDAGLPPDWSRHLSVSCSS